MMQQMSHSRDQWQMNAHGLDSLNYVTTRSNSQERLQSRTRSSTHVDLEKVFSQNVFLKKIQMIIFEQNHPPFFFVQSISLSKKNSKESSKTNIFSKEIFYMSFFLAWKTSKKDENTRKHNRKSRKFEKHNKRKRISRTIEK